MTPQEQLCEKMRVEQSAYCLWLTAQPPDCRLSVCRDAAFAWPGCRL